MALRWDLKPVFPNASPDSDAARITRRSVISGALAIGAFIFVASLDLPYWQTILIGLGLVAAFDAGDMAVPFEDDGEIFEEVEDPDADRPLSAREKLYRPVEER